MHYFLDQFLFSLSYLWFYINIRLYNTKSIIIDMGGQCFPFSLSAFMYVCFYLFLSQNKYETPSKAVLPFIYTYLHHDAAVTYNMHPGTGSINVSY